MQVIRKGMQGEKRIEVRSFRRTRKETNKLGFGGVARSALGSPSGGAGTAYAVTERGKEAWYTLSVSFADSSPKGRAKASADAGSHPHKFLFFAELTGRWAQWRQYVMPTFVTNCLQAQPGRGAQGQLYLVPNVRNALAAGLARQIPICCNLFSKQRQGNVLLFSP